MDKYTLPQLLDLLWKDYVETNPPAQHIYDLFVSRGEKVINDHVAFRTFDHPRININVLGKAFVDLGYVEMGDYHFEQKKLYARHFEHPNPEMPLIFISQLKTGEFDRDIRQIIENLVAQIPDDFDAFQGVDVRMHVAHPHPLLMQVFGQVLGHALGEGRHQRALALLGRVFDLHEQVIDLILHRADDTKGIDQPRRPHHLLCYYASGTI